MAGQINVAVVGSGAVAGGLATEASRLPEFNMYAFMDVVESKARELCEKLGGSYFTTDLNRIIEDPKVDAVMICTLPDTHTPLAKTFLSLDKNVFLQKPTAVTYEQCRELVKAEAASKGKVMAAYCYRLSPLVRKVKEVMPHPQAMFARMMVGDVAESHKHYFDMPAVGQPMIDLACHNFDMIYWMAGCKPVRVTASGGNMRHPGTDLIDNFSATIEFENGSIGTLMSVDCGANEFKKKWYAEFYGQGTSAIIDSFVKLNLYGVYTNEMTCDYRSGIGLNRDMIEFRNLVANGMPSTCTAKDSTVATLILLKAFESLASGKPEAIDVDALLA